MCDFIESFIGFINFIQKGLLQTELYLFLLIYIILLSNKILIFSFSQFDQSI